MTAMPTAASAPSLSRARDREIVIARDFSPFPGGRFERHGPHSGEAFRKKHLVPALNEARAEAGRAVVILDGVVGYAGSFLEEAFGGLVRVDGFTKNELASILEVRSDALVFRPYRDLALQYIEDAVAEARTG